MTQQLKRRISVETAADTVMPDVIVRDVLADFTARLGERGYSHEQLKRATDRVEHVMVRDYHAQPHSEENRIAAGKLAAAALDEAGPTQVIVIEVPATAVMDRGFVTVTGYAGFDAEYPLNKLLGRVARWVVKTVRGEL